MKKGVTASEGPRSGFIQDEAAMAEHSPDATSFWSSDEGADSEPDAIAEGTIEVDPAPEEKEAAKKPYRPWRHDFVDGLMLLAGGAVTVAILIHSGLFPDRQSLRSLPNGLGAAGCLSALWGALRIRRGLVRSRGKAIERRAAKNVRKRVPKTVTVEESVMLPGWGGDADILITDTRSGRRWVVEVKSQAMVQVRSGMLTGSTLLYNPVGRRGDFNPRKAIAQARAVAAKFGAQPVLWFPAASRRQPTSFGSVNDVLIVCGPVKLLLKRAQIPTKGLFG